MACAIAAVSGCGEARGSPDAAGPVDAAVALDAADGGGAPAWPGPEGPEPPRMTCAPGWTPVPDDEGVVIGCNPWPGGTRATCTAIDEAHFPGEPGCGRVGDACPAGDFPEGLPAGATVLYVRAGAPSGGDGSLAAPFSTIAGALTAAPDGATLALAKGTYAEAVGLRRSVTIWGACAAETTIASPSAVYSVLTSGPVVALRGVHLRGGGGLLQSAGDLTLRGVVVTDSGSDALALLSGSTAIDDVIVRRAGAAAVLVGVHGSAALRRVAIEDPADAAITSTGGPVGASDVAAHGAGVLSTFAVLAQGVAHVALERFVLEGPSAFIVAGESTLVVRDAWLDGDGGGPREFDGLQAYDGTRVRLERVRLDRARANALFVAESADALLVDSTITRVVDASPGYGRAVDVEGGGHVTLTRVRVDEARQIGVFATDPGSHVQLADVVVRRTRSDASGLFGRGVQAQLGATVDGVRVRLDENREVSLAAASPGTRVTVADLDLAGTMERECVTSSCSGAGGGIGVGAYLEGTISLERARIRQNVLVGLQVARDGMTDLSVGEVSDNPVGANVQVDGYDFMRLSNRVAYLRNGANLDSRALPVPDPTPPAAAP